MKKTEDKIIDGEKNFSSENFLEKVKTNSIEKFQFWSDIQKFYEKNEIKDVKLLVSCFENINEIFKSDYASGEFYTWLEKFSESNLEIGIQIKDEIEKNPSRDTYEFWASVVYGLSKSENNFEEEIINNIISDTGYLVSAGLRAATIVKPKAKSTFYSHIDSPIHLDNFKEVFEDIDWAYLMNFYARHLEDYSKFDERIRELLEIDSVYLYSALVRALNSYIKLDKNEALFYLSIERLSKVPLKYSGIYNTLNYSFNKYYESNPKVIEFFLEKWIDNQLPNAAGMQVLENLVNKFNDKNPKYFHRLISIWLLKSQNYGLAVQYIVSEVRNSRDKLQLDIQWLRDLDVDDIVLLSLRVIGFVWDKDVAYKMLFQILQTHINSQEIINNTASLIYSELLLNYPSLIERLKNEDISDRKLKSVAAQITKRADEYFNRLSELSVYEEFKPSEKRLAYYNKIQFSQLGGEALESKKSSFLDFVDKTQLRAGKGFFSKTEYGFTEIMEPKRISHSMEMPRLEFIDPIGQQTKRLHFRYISKDELYNS